MTTSPKADVIATPVPPTASVSYELNLDQINSLYPQAVVRMINDYVAEYRHDYRREFGVAAPDKLRLRLMVDAAEPPPAQPVGYWIHRESGELNPGDRVAWFSRPVKVNAADPFPEGKRVIRVTDFHVVVDNADQIGPQELPVDRDFFGFYRYES